LLDRKRQKEREKEEGEKEATRQLLQEVTQEKRAQSEAQIARANQLMLYRKGLIRDFHSSLAYSKVYIILYTIICKHSSSRLFLNQFIIDDARD
jgi:hypothetical protein